VIVFEIFHRLTWRALFKLGALAIPLWQPKTLTLLKEPLYNIFLMLSNEMNRSKRTNPFRFLSTSQPNILWGYAR
jgi:hypothetical protein